MSIRWDLIEIVCDGPAGAGKCPESRSMMGYGSAEWLRDKMTREGWLTSIPKSKDRCPNCRRGGAR